MPVAQVQQKKFYGSKAPEPTDEADFELYDSDLWFLDELCDEGMGDLLSYIPEEDSSLLQNERQSPV